MTKTKFAIVLYKVLIYSFLFIGLAFVLFGVFTDANYFAKFTITKKLGQATVQRIKELKTASVIMGIVLFGFNLILLRNKNSVVAYINKKRKILQNLLLFLISLIFVVVFLELMLRIFLPHEIKYAFTPGFKEFDRKYVTFNSEGFRDVGHTIGKKSNVIRIAGIGDSFTFGEGVYSVNDTYLKKLEQKLNNNSKMRYETLNFGIRGTDTEKAIDVLKNNAIKYKPDIVIYGYVLNDFRDIEGIIQKKEPNFYLFWLNRYLRDNFYLYYFAYQGINRFKELYNLKETYYETLIRSFDSENDKNFNKLYFKELKKLSKENNFRLIVIIFPLLYELDDYPFIKAHEFVKETSTENEIEVIDLLPYFKEYKEEAVAVSKFDAHPNELGFEITASAVYEHLKS